MVLRLFLVVLPTFAASKGLLALPRSGRFAGLSVCAFGFIYDAEQALFTQLARALFAVSFATGRTVKVRERGQDVVATNQAALELLLLSAHAHERSRATVAGSGDCVRAATACFVLVQYNIFDRQRASRQRTLVEHLESALVVQLCRL